MSRCRVVLVGDPKQLPATVKSLVAQKLSLARSLFERLQVWWLLVAGNSVWSPIIAACCTLGVGVLSLQNW